MDDPRHPETLLERVARLEDLEAIRTLKARYATGGDLCLSTPSHDHAVALVSLFTDDAVGDYGPFGRFQGREQIVHAFENVLPGAVSWSRHYVTNPAIEVSGNQATGGWYFLVHAVPKGAPPGSPTVTFFGVYEDTYVKTAQGWRFSSLIARFIDPPR
jgi:hypothetical protein